MLKNSFHPFCAAVFGVSSHHLTRLRRSESVLEGDFFDSTQRRRRSWVFQQNRWRERSAEFPRAPRFIADTRNPLGVVLPVPAPENRSVEEAQRERSEGGFTRAGGSHAGSVRGL